MERTNRYLPVLDPTKAATSAIPKEALALMESVAQAIFKKCCQAFEDFPEEMSRQDRLIRLAREASVVCDNAIALNLSTLPPTEKPPACQRNCPHCCRIQVTVASSELGNIFTYVQDHFSKQEIAALARRVFELSRKCDEVFGTKDKRGYSERFLVGMHRFFDESAAKKREALNTPCPFLVAGECSIYPVRPFVCRGYTSQNVEDCEKNRPITQNAGIFAVGQAMLTGMAAFENSIQEHSPVELTEGVRAIFEGLCYPT